VGNAVGTLADAPLGTTAALLIAVGDRVEGRYDTFETCFVWDSNASSVGANRYLRADPVRRYSVWTTS
jgi:hypothetical protein